MPTQEEYRIIREHKEVKELQKEIATWKKRKAMMEIGYYNRIAMCLMNKDIDLTVYMTSKDRMWIHQRHLAYTGVM